MVAAACLYALLAPRFYVGHFGDDARDILASKALLQGSYSNLQLPGHPPLNFPLPGFALFLMPFVALFQKHLEWLKLVPISLCLGSIFLVYQLWKDDLSPTALGLLLAFFAFNPTTLALSSTVISDTPYLFMLLFTFVLLRHPPDWRRNLWLWMATGGAVLLRPEGTFLFLCVTAALAWTKKWKTLAGAIGVIGLWAGVLLWNHARTGSASGYISIFHQSLPILSQGLGSLIRHIAALLKSLVLEVLFGVMIELQTPLRLFFITALIWIVIVFLLAGCRRWLESKQTPPAVGLAVGLYVFFHLWVHSIWLAVDAHYLWPILPFAAFFIVYFVDHIPERRIKKRAAATSVALLTLLYGWQAVFAVRQTVESPPGSGLAAGSLEWVRRQLPPDAFILSPLASVITLYTRRYSTAFIGGNDPDDFHYRVLQKGFTHVLVSPFQVLYVQTSDANDPMKGWERSQRWLETETGSYEPLYANEAERIRIYRVQPAPKFQEAYAQYSRLLETLRASPRPDWDAQLVLLDAILKLDSFPAALNAYGVAALFSNHHLPLARRHLEEAVKVRPDFTTAWRNLARIYQRLGKPELERQAWVHAGENPTR
jgi:4-amino-4-deoxy-L-arabinose transferase-like glycosyltransferase